MVRRALPSAALVLLLAREARSSPSFFRNGDEGLPPPGAITSLEHRAPRCEAEWRSLYWDLFRDAGFGVSRTERAAWVVWDDPRTVRLVRWPHGAIERHERWSGSVTGAIAILHTHPNDLDPRPSAADLELAARLGLPIYTVSREGVFRGTPDGRVARVEGGRWFDGCSGSSGCPHPVIDQATGDVPPPACGAA